MYADARTTSAAPPIAIRKPITRTHHGEVFVDPYEWLRDKDNPEVISYLEAENAYTEAQTAHLSELSEAVFSEIKARTKETDLSVPSYSSHPGARRTGTTFVPSKDLSIHLLPGCRGRSRKTARPRTGDRRRGGTTRCQPRGRRP